MQKSIYGSGAAHRDHTLTELPDKTAEVNTANSDYEKLSKAPHATDAQKASALAKAQEAYAKYKPVYDSYRQLPEEADAWHARSAVRELLSH